MKVVCINKNGWYLHKGNLCGFLEPRQSEGGNVFYGDECEVLSSFVDNLGDLFYILDGKGQLGYEAEFFAIPIQPEKKLTAELEIAP